MHVLVLLFELGGRARARFLLDAFVRVLVLSAAIDIARATGDCDLEQGRNARETAGRVYALLTGLIRRYDCETIGPKSSHAHELDIENELEHEHERG